MAWAGRANQHYGLMMTDGYISPSQIVLPPCSSNALSVEQAMAQHLFRLHKRPRSPPHIARPDPLHVWVVGTDNWLDQVLNGDSLFRGIHENELNPNYRMIILGMGWPENGSYFGDSGGWLRQAGMTKKKKHTDLSRFRYHSDILLDLMFDNYREDRTAPSIVLDRFEVPYTFYGDEPNGREERLLDRIQVFSPPRNSLAAKTPSRVLAQLDRYDVPYTLQRRRK